MSLTMTPSEREEFLADVHVGILSVDEPGQGPLTVPVWYRYTPGGRVTFVTGKDSRKARRLRSAGRCSLCAQSEAPPYGYVSVEGPVEEHTGPVDEDERRAMAVRYLGTEIGELYLATTEADAIHSVNFALTPERWRTADFAKQLGERLET